MKSIDLSPEADRFIIAYPPTAAARIVPNLKHYFTGHSYNRADGVYEVPAKLENAGRLIQFADVFGFAIYETARKHFDKMHVAANLDRVFPDRIICQGLDKKGNQAIHVKTGQFVRAIYDRVSAMAGAQFVDRYKAWAVPPSEACHVQKLANDFHFTVDAATRGWLEVEAAKEKQLANAGIRRRAALLEAAKDIPRGVFGGKTPREYQVLAVSFLIDAFEKYGPGSSAGLFDDMGLGKTFIAMLVARCFQRAFNADVVVISVLSVKSDWAKEAQACGVRASVHTWGSIPASHPRPFILIADECFPSSTMVDTDKGKLPIDEIVNSRLPVSVLCYDTERKQRQFRPIVRYVRKQAVGDLYRLTHEGGEIVATGNHKFWIEDKGYVQLKEIVSGSNLRILSDTVSDAHEGQEYGEVLHSKLCSECNSVIADNQRQTIGSKKEATDREGLRVVQEYLHHQVGWQGIGGTPLLLKGLLKLNVGYPAALCRSNAQPWADKSESCTHRSPASRCGETDARKQPNAHGWNKRQDDSNAQRDRSQAVNTRRQWSSFSQAIGSQGRFLFAPGRGVCNCHQCGTSIIRADSDVLQGRLGAPGQQDGNRDRRKLTQFDCSPSAGSKEGNGTSLSRVVSVEVYQQGSGQGCEGGSGQDCTVYNLEVAEHHNYFANGVLVSNCHYAQDSTSQRSQAMVNLGLSANCICAIPATGTPHRGGRMTNIYPLLKLMRHPIAKDKRQYDDYWANNSKALMKQVAPIYLRRTKDQVLKDLPPEIITTRNVTPSPAALKLYNEAYNEARARYEIMRDVRVEAQCEASGLDYKAGMKEGAEALVLLGILRKAASLGKMEGCQEIVDEIVEQDRKILIFTEFPDTAAAMAAHYNKRGIKSELLTGKTNRDIRPEMVKRFQYGDSRLWFSTIKAGGVGLTLTAADTVILHDQPWIIDDALQAKDRARREDDVMRKRINEQKDSCLSVYWLRGFEIDTVIQKRLAEQAQALKDVESGAVANVRGVKSINQMAAEVAREMFKREKT
jgi:hypothetical protein